MIPVATTTIRVLRQVPAPEPYEAAEDDHGDPVAPTVIAAGVRAQISTSKGAESSSGTQEIVDFRLSCDPVELDHDDRVEDERTNLVYEVTWARQRFGLGLDHTEAGLRQITGVVSSPRLVLGQ